MARIGYLDAIGVAPGAAAPAGMDALTYAAINADISSMCDVGGRLRGDIANCLMECAPPNYAANPEGHLAWWAKANARARVIAAKALLAEVQK